MADGSQYFSKIILLHYIQCLGKESNLEGKDQGKVFPMNRNGKYQQG